MKTNELIEKLKKKHSLLLNEYSKGNANKEVMQMYRSQMKDILDFINDLESLEKTAVEKTVVRVAWSQKASDMFQEEGWDALEKASEDGVEDLVFEKKEFNTPAEAIAYTEGINDANGWDEPMAEIVDNKIEETN